VLLLTHHEIGVSLKAQADYVGTKEMRRGGFTGIKIATIVALDIQAQEKIRKIGKNLGWKTGRTLLPSMSFLSKAVGREQDYKFLYHGTSRYVHFSTQELLRRVWGKKGNVTITSSSFRDYWEHFAISWGTRLFLDVVDVCLDDSDDGELVFTGDTVAEMAELVKVFAAKVPIITTGELIGWSQEPEREQ
jgi:hypothetical protein